MRYLLHHGAVRASTCHLHIPVNYHVRKRTASLQLPKSTRVYPNATARHKAAKCLLPHWHSFVSAKELQCLHHAENLPQPRFAMSLSSSFPGHIIFPLQNA